MNVVLIVVDTLRADHLGCYGYGRDTSPNVDALAAEGLVFEQLIAPAIPTHPAFTTLNTGQFSITHGVVAHGGDHDVPRTAPWLPRIFQQQGYTTCAVDNLADWRYGFGRGYEFYIDPTKRRALSINCDNREINRRVIPWIEQHKEEQFFLFVHYWDPHTPYLPPRAYRTLFYKGDPCDKRHHSLEGMEAHPLGRTWRETWFKKLGKDIRDAAYIEALYDGEIRYCDEGVGELLGTLERLGLNETTLVVFTSDHGEVMCRNGIFFDHHGLYEENLHVPLVLRGPDVTAGRVPHMAAEVDVAPTLLDLCGIPVPEVMEGVSLAPWVRRERNDDVRDAVVCEECTWQMKWAIRTARHKFILAREPDFYGTPMRELYDLAEDPQETKNLAETAPELAADLEARLENLIAEKMRRNGLTEDPLVTHGLSLGKRWKEERGE